MSIPGADERPVLTFTDRIVSPPGGNREETFRGQERELLAILSTHGEREGAALASYARLVEQSEDNGIRYLGRLILEDEERHHRIIDEMLNSVRSFVEELEIEPRAPTTVGQVSDELLAETKRLLAFEKHDLAELRRLRKDLKRTTAYRLLALLVDLMIQDTRKHIEILKFIRASA